MNTEDEKSYMQSEVHLPEEDGFAGPAVAEAAPTIDAGAEAEGLPGDTAVVPGDNSTSGQNKHGFREIVETVLVTLLIFFVVRAVIQNFKVEGDSMLPTLHSEQYLLVNKGLYFRYDANFLARIFNPSAPADMHYLFHGPQRGDIVVFQSPTEPRDFIKRVIAVEGETVQIKPDPDSVGRPGEPCGDCGVYVNGVKLDEPYVKATPDYTVDPITVPPGDIYVLGDNRRNSSDSHVWGPLDVGKIVGVAFLSYWPTNEWGLLPHPTYAAPQK
jgi:signal peptidase I